MTRNVAGAEYVAAITASDADCRARSAFQNLVLKIAPAGAALYDFGAGPGIDARLYSQRGFKVAAYDVDPAMCEFFAEYCRDLIDQGQIALERGSYREFLAREAVCGGRLADLVTANFAPLSLVSNLHNLFAKFHSLTAPDGKVLASVLNPYFRGDLKYRWWWRNVIRLWRYGHYSVPGAQAPIVRRRLVDFAAQSEPYFSLERVYRGLPPLNIKQADGIDVSSGARRAWLHLTGSQFMFLLFRKRKQPP